MGLIYQFPTKLEKNYSFLKNNQLILKTYGLPKIFWFYYLFLMIFYFTLFFLMYKNLVLFKKLDPVLGSIAYFFFIIFPFIPLVFFYYEKSLILEENFLTIKKKCFFTFSKKIFLLETLILRKFLDSPNYAKIHQKHASFQNKGYFILLGKNSNQEFFIDRSSQGTDLVLLSKIFQDYNKKLILKDETIL